jgi:hypothetical protein
VSSASNEILKNYTEVRERIAAAATRSGRRAEDITLIAVTKTHPASRILNLYDAGARHFGENRVQERESKLVDTARMHATWHMIGHLQKNKVARIPGMFQSVDSVDSIALAEKLDRTAGEFLKNKNESGDLKQNAFENRLRVLIEVKLDPEPSKSGAPPEELPRLVESVLRMPHLNLQGLMSVPPFFDNPQDARPYFRQLREIRDMLRKEMSAQILPVLSTGMSHDFEVAIEEGATEVRVGTALFGQRDYGNEPGHF